MQGGRWRYIDWENHYKNLTAKENVEETDSDNKSKDDVMPIEQPAVPIMETNDKDDIETGSLLTVAKETANMFETFMQNKESPGPEIGENCFKTTIAIYDQKSDNEKNTEET